MLFINISSDYVHLLDDHQELFLERNSIEDTLGPSLIKRYRDFGIDEIFLLNGPGGFTNLRVGCLALNFLNQIVSSEGTVANKGIPMYSISKVELYNFLWKQGFLPEEVVLYIGQRKNIWKLNVENKSWEQSTLATLSQSKTYDWVYDKAYWGDIDEKQMITFVLDQNQLAVVLGAQKHILDIHKLGLQPIYVVEPEYMIDPIMG